MSSVLPLDGATPFPILPPLQVLLTCHVLHSHAWPDNFSQEMLLCSAYFLINHGCAFAVISIKSDFGFPSLAQLSLNGLFLRVEPGLCSTEKCPGICLVCWGTCWSSVVTPLPLRSLVKSRGIAGSQPDNCLHVLSSNCWGTVVAPALVLISGFSVQCPKSQMWLLGELGTKLRSWPGRILVPVIYLSPVGGQFCFSGCATRQAC